MPVLYYGNLSTLYFYKNSFKFTVSKDVNLMICRKNATYFIDAKESTTVSELKKMLWGITQKPIEDMRLYKDNVGLRPYDDSRTLGDVGFTSAIARPQSPALVGLVFRPDSEGQFEELDIEPLSMPPDLPEVMKSEEH